MTYVSRTKQQRNQLRDNRPTLSIVGLVRLQCGCVVDGDPQLSNPFRFWCPIHLDWQAKRA